MSKASRETSKKKNDSKARVRNSAISAADSFNRLNKDLEKLVDALKEEMADENGQLSVDEATDAILEAGRGRPDREKALLVILNRISDAL